MKTSLLTATVVAGLLLTGCGASAAPTASDPAPAGDPTQLVLRIGTEGGFVPVLYGASQSAELSVYADGTAISQGPQIDIYPSPALPNYLEQQLSGEELADLIDSAATALRDIPDDLGMTGVADAPDTVITVVTTDGVQTARANALGLDDSLRPLPSANEPTAVAGSLTEEQVAGRAAMRDVQERAWDLAGGGDGTAYEPTSWRVFAVPYALDPEDSTSNEARWPGPTIRDADGSVVELTVPAAVIAEVADLGANANTGWKSGGTTWQLAFRPVLPDETP